MRGHEFGGRLTALLNDVLILRNASCRFPEVESHAYGCSKDRDRFLVKCTKLFLRRLTDLSLNREICTTQ